MRAIVAAGILAGGAVLAGALPRGTPAAAATSGMLTIAVPDVPGPYCLYGAEKRLRELPEVAEVDLRWEEEEIRVLPRAGATLTPAMLRGAMERSKYPSRYSID